MTFDNYEHCWESMDFSDWIDVVLKYTRFRVKNSWYFLSRMEQEELISDAMYKILRAVENHGRPRIKTATGWIRRVLQTTHIDILRQRNRGGGSTSLEDMDVEETPLPSWRRWHSNLPEPGSDQFFQRITLKEILSACQVSEGSEAIRRMVSCNDYHLTGRTSPVYTDSGVAARANAVIRMRKEIAIHSPDALELLTGH